MKFWAGIYKLTIPPESELLDQPECHKVAEASLVIRLQHSTDWKVIGPIEDFASGSEQHIDLDSHAEQCGVHEVGIRLVPAVDAYDEIEMPLALIDPSGGTPVKQVF